MPTLGLKNQKFKAPNTTWFKPSRQISLMACLDRQDIFCGCRGSTLIGSNHVIDEALLRSHLRSTHSHTRHVHTWDYILLRFNLGNTFQNNSIRVDPAMAWLPWNWLSHRLIASTLLTFQILPFLRIENSRKHFSTFQLDTRLEKKCSMHLITEFLDSSCLEVVSGRLPRHLCL